MLGVMERLRTPDDRFADLPDFAYAPRYVEVAAGDGSAPLRMAYVDEGPRGLCRGAPSKLRRADVSAVYFLRRAVPWTQAAPVLVVEAKGEAFIYPRDWFDSESDQRRIVDELTPS